MPTLTQQQIDNLQAEINTDDISGFYALLESYSDDYGRLGAAVTDNDTWQGELANAFAAYGAGDNSVDLSYQSTAWTNLNKAIAEDYLQAYRDNSNATPAWDTVQEIHNDAYVNAGLDADDWLPNKLLNDSGNPAALWADYQTNDGAGDVLQDALGIIAGSGKLLFGPYLLYQALTNETLDPSEVAFAKALLNGLNNMSDTAIADMANDANPLQDLGDWLSQLPQGTRSLIDDYGWAIGNPGDLLESVKPGWLSDPETLWGDAPDQQSPLVLDLDGDGIELTTFNAATTTTFFDIDNDGFAEQTAWVGADDGLLVRDVDENGMIDDGSELFGSATVDGFALLQQLDSNGNLIINQYDDDWGDLMIWKDANGDAVSQEDELESLSFYDIVSIDLAGVAASTSTINGNPISHTSTFKYDNGSTDAIVDAWFVHDNVNTAYTGDYTLDIRALFLPTLRGFGALPDLHIAMSENEDLLDLVTDFVTGWDYDVFADGNQLRSDIEDILYEWAGVTGVSPTSRGPFADARQLGFMEKFFGEDFLYFGVSTDFGPRSGRYLTETWDLLVRNMNSQLLIQISSGVPYDSDVSYDPFSGELSGTFDLDQSWINSLVSYSTDTGVDTHDYWIQIADIIQFTKGLDNVSGTEEGWFDTALSNAGLGDTWDDLVDSYESLFAHDVTPINGTSGDDTLNGTVGNDFINGNGGDDTFYGDLGHDVMNAGAPSSVGSELYGENGNDTLTGNTGDDILSGGSGGDEAYGRGGDDTYIFTGGGDIYSEYTYSGSDTIELPSGIDSGDLTIYRSSTKNLFIEVDGLGTIEIDEQYTTGSSHPYAIEEIKFYDTSTLNLLGFTILEARGTDGDDDIRGLQISSTHVDDTIYGYGGADDLFGYGGDDVLDGGAGNDNLYGGVDDDAYVVSAGFDRVYETSGTDQIIVPEGFDQSEVEFIRTLDNPNDLLINVSGLGQILIDDHFYNSSKSVESIYFNEDSSSINFLTYSFETRGDEGNNNLSAPTAGAGSGNIFNGMEGNDTMNGGSGDDTYIFSEGDDKIYETGGSTGDTLVFWEGWDTGDITISRQQSLGFGWDDLILEDTQGNSVIIESHFDNANAALEYVEFHDTTQWVLSTLDIAIHGTSGADSISVTDSEDLIVYGFESNDTISTYTGADYLDGGAGNDTLNGNTGNDTYVFSLGEDNATDTGGSSDTLFFGGSWDTEDITVYRTYIPGNGYGYDDLVIEDQSGNFIAFQNHFYSSSYELEYIDFNGVTQWDVLALTDIPLYGQSYGESLIGTSGDDIMYGLGGNDNLYGYGGDDYLDGGEGNDYLRGYADNDTYAYSEGLDTVEDTAGTDTLLVTGGITINDISVSDYSTYDTKVIINASTDEVTLKSHRSSWVIENLEFDDGFVTDQLADYSVWLWGTSGNDSVTGNANDNVLIGKDGNDTITGNAGNDDAHGGAGTDTINGGDGDDLLHGGAGDDALYGEDGFDKLFGGAGADSFMLEDTTAFNDQDEIHDFNTGEGDKLDISDILTSTSYDHGVDPITDWVQMTTDGSDTVVKLDVTGSASFGSGTEIATLLNVTGLTDEAALLGSGNLIAA